MKRSIISEIVLAAGLTAASFPIWLLACFSLGMRTGDKATLVLIGSIYLWLLFKHSKRRTGRIVLAALVFPLLPLGWIWGFNLSQLIVLFGIVTAVVRGLLTYSSPLALLADAALCLIAVKSAFVAVHSGWGIGGVIWVYFLVQSLAVLIPEKLFASQKSTGEGLSGREFERNYVQVQAALRQLAGDC